ncbi:interferon-induced protein with tetratricopeptide repeats 2-like isoform X1 [Poecilia reticulata]|uniref:interferon-induced protein with tetratricopeptide repeats 2-like isoform X1 n=1 Tax=Poecilia reticulata TaxID=8081 RepID=UPI0007EBC64F|nr:PREDICTED: interferon-induced protein with tetratricopeptide repeats 2-like isoform X1 [Poecilia reticulata]
MRTRGGSSTETPSSHRMSSAQSLEDKLKALQSHFTWELQPRRPNFKCELNILQDIGSDEGNVWLGHVYNLQGFIQYQLGSSEDALNLFNRAAETFQRQKNADEGPWLMVNFGNLAWLHHHLGEDEKSEDYLSKVDGLMRKYPPGLERHPEVLAEKAWTLMMFDKEKKQQAAELFQRAIRMQPDTVEWQSSCAILSAESFTKCQSILEPEVFERLRSAKERDPGNLYVAALYLEAKATNGEQIQDEARELARKVLERPPSSYNGIRPLLRMYRNKISKDEAVEIAEKALEKHPDSRYFKKSAAICHKKRIRNQDRQEPKPPRSVINRAISLWEEMIADYDDSSFKQQITLADLYEEVDKEKAHQIYKELLLREDLDPEEKQRLYNSYAKHLFFVRNDSRKSIEYHMRAAEIQVESPHRQHSITELEKTVRNNRNPELFEEITKLLTSLTIQPQNQ